MVNEQCRKAEIGCVQCKKIMAEFLVKAMEPLHTKRQYYENNPKLVDEIIITGGERARKVACETMEQVRSAIKIK
jgi:tryptophanyl-tRNA synthetase